MKTLGLCVVALVATICSGYIPGREYHYHTEGKILQEFEKKVHQHAGFMFKGELLLQAKDHGAIIKLVDTKFRLVNERPPDTEEDRIYHSSPFAKEELSKPFEIICENGVVKEVKVAKDDSIWSVNLKKSIASKFVLQTDFANSRFIRSPDTKDDDLALDRKNYYETLEDGIHGECQVDYEVDDSHENVVKVTKISNFENCETATYRFYINHDKFIPLQAQGDVHAPVRKSEVSHYTLQGNRQKFVIEKMTAKERLVFTPYGHDADFIHGDATVLLELKGSEDVKEAMEMPDDAVTHSTLHFQFEEPVEIQDAEDLKKEPHSSYHFLKQKIPLENVVEHFNRIVNIRADGEQYTEIFKDKAMPVLFMQLASGMSTFNYDELQQFLDDHVVKEAKDDSNERNQRRDLFVDALAYCGTSSSFMFLKHMILEKQITTFALPHVLQQLPLTLRESSPVLIEEFYTMCTDPHVQDTPSIRKICFLAFSKFIHNQCLARHDNVYVRFNTTEKIQCDPEIAEKYFQKILARYENHFKDSFEFSSFMKIATNLATRGAMKYIMKIIHDFSLPTYYRFSAITALSAYEALYEDELRVLMIPIYFNTSEVHEIRISALDIIMAGPVQMNLVEAIAENLEHEPDHQVAHYTMTVFQENAELKNHDTHFEMSNRVLRYLKRVDFKTKFDLRHSFSWGKQYFNEKWRIGGGSGFTYITSSRSYVPRYLDSSSYNLIGNVIEVPVEIEYVGYGLDKYIDQIISFKKQKKSVFDFLRRKTRDVDIVEKELKEIDEKLHIDERTYEPVYGDISIYAYGSLVNFFHFNETTFHSVATHGANVLPAVFNALKDLGKFSTKRFVSGKQFKFVFPSMLGVPLYVDVSEAGFFYYRNNNMKFGIQPDIFAAGPKDETPVSINLKMDGQLVHELARVVSVGALYPSIGISTGAGILKRDYASSPMNFKLSLEPNTPKLVFKQKPVVPHVRMHKTFLPFTMLYNMSKVHGDLKDGSFLPYARKNELHEFDMETHFLEKKVGLNGSYGELHLLESEGSVKKFLVEHGPKELISYLNHNPLAIPYDLDFVDKQEEEHDIVVTAETFGYDTPPDKSYKPDFPTVQDGHEKYINSRGDRKACTCLLRSERISKGGAERKVITEISYTRTFDDLYHVMNIFYDRSPIGPSDHDPFKVCYSSSILFPHVDTKKLHDLDTVNMDPKIEVATDIHFGKNCENDKKIKLRAEMSRTEEHKHMQADRENPEVQCPRTNKDAYLYKKCKADIAKGVHYSINCRKYHSRSLKLRHYSIDIEHENLDSDDKNFLARLDTCLKNVMYPYLDEHRSEVEHDANKIHVEANFSARTDHVDIKITKPHKILELDHVPHPHWIQARIANPLFEFSNKMRLWSRYKWPFCSVEGDNVHTFDYAHYHLAPTDCYKVLAKDCSHKELFTVLGKKITHNRFNKAVKVFIPNWKIEALPVSAESDILVRLNGQHIPVTEAEPHFHYETIGGKHVLIFTVSFNGLYYKIKSEQYGITVYYDGKSIVMNISPYYIGKQCGLCGEYNNNERDIEEFLGPRHHVHHNTTDFSKSYTIPEDDCH